MLNRSSDIALCLDVTVRSRLAVLNEKLVSLERVMDYLEASIQNVSNAEKNAANA